MTFRVLRKPWLEFVLGLALVALAAAWVLSPAPARASEADVYWTCKTTNPVGWCPTSTTNPLPVNAGGYEFSASVVPVVQNAAYAAGQSLGGLQTISIGTTSGISGILAQIEIGSTGGSTAALVAYVWSKNPTSTTCTDKTNFVSSAADNRFLVVNPQPITPALAVTAQDTSAYGVSTGLVGPFVNGSSNTNLFVCVLANAAVTPATVSDLRFVISGIKDQP